jgi:hypothetical protein
MVADLEQQLRALLSGQQNVLLVPAAWSALDFSTLSGDALGRLFGLAWSVATHDAYASAPVSRIARLMLERCETVAPEFDFASGQSALEAIGGVAIDQDSVRGDDSSYAAKAAIEKRIKALETLLLGMQPDDLPRIRDSVAGVTAPLDLESKNSVLFAMVSFCDKARATKWIETLFDPSIESTDFRMQELRALTQVATRNVRVAILAARSMDRWSDAMDDDEIDPPGQYLLAGIPEFVGKAAVIFASASAHLERIHSGFVPYASDKAFALDDAHALSRGVSTLLDRKDTLLDAGIELLLRRTSVAPVASAKTAPSQAAAIGIAKAIAERPTLSALLALGNTVKVIRHAGLQKKLGRLHKVAERRLTQRPDFVGDLPVDFVLPKGLLSAAKRSFEYLYRSRVSFTASEFEARILANKALAEIACNLVWHASEPGGQASTVRPIKERSRWAYIDSQGEQKKVEPDCAMRLWHPLGAVDGLTDSWQTAVLKNGIKQPFNQVFRETYALAAEDTDSSEISLFAGYEVDAKVMVGVSLKSGWTLLWRDGLYTAAGDLRFFFDSPGLYPMGRALTGNIRVESNGSPIAFGSVDKVIVSEILRLADLLVSVSLFGKATEQEPKPSRAGLSAPGVATARARRSLFVKLFGEQSRSDGPWVDGNYVRVRDIKIHLGTGIARRGGEAVQFENAKAATSFPYEDPVLDKISREINGAIAS